MRRYRPYFYKSKAHSPKRLDHPTIFVESGRHAQWVGKVQAAHLGCQPCVCKGKETGKQMAAKRGRADPLGKREGLLVDALWIATEQEGADEALVCAGIHKIIRRWTQMDAE